MLTLGETGKSMYGLNSYPHFQSLTVIIIFMELYCFVIATNEVAAVKAKVLPIPLFKQGSELWTPPPES